MGKGEEEIQPLNPEDSLVDMPAGADSPKSKSPRHGHSTSKEVIGGYCFKSLLVPALTCLLSCKVALCTHHALLDLALTMRSGCISSDIQLGVAALSQRLVCRGCQACL